MQALLGFALPLLLQLNIAFASAYPRTLNNADIKDPSLRCRALLSHTGFGRTTIVNATYYPKAAPVDGLPQSQCLLENKPTNVTVPLCRVSFVVNTTDSSQVKAEAWLPDEWYGRFLAAGNGGLNGCIDYSLLTYGTSLHFATVAGNNGHDGGAFDGTSFYQHPEVLNDFTTRSIHTISVIGKEIVKQYYSRPNNKSYYLGCSSGGRQGTYSALHYPDDFDGIIAGAPATNWNNLLGKLTLVSTAVGAPNGTTSPSFLTQQEWSLVNQEVFRQCDSLDGLVDGIITEPDNCDFQPEALLCSNDGSNNGTDCLSAPQVDALKEIYSPLLDSNGKLLYSRYSPGAESTYTPFLFGGDIIGFATGWWRYVVYTDPKYNFQGFGLKDIAAATEMDPGHISTFDGDFSAFRDRGGKFLTWHGTHDNIIPHNNSKRLYDLISANLSEPSLDDFYRLFLVPGMDHCALGKTNYTFGQGTKAYVPPKNDTTHNILLALVDWVEGNEAPDSFVTTNGAGEERVACRYPAEKNVWDGKKYVCEAY
jgi:feruloyl esterase